MEASASISNSNHHSGLENTLDVKSPSPKNKGPQNLKECEIEFGTTLFPGRVVMILPIRTESEAQNLPSKTRFYKNGKPKTEHWTEKHARHRKQKKTVYFAMIPLREKMEIPLPCIVKLTRYASKFLDEDDNLRISVKWIKDFVAAMLTNDFVPGRADGDKRIKWQYDQVKSKTYAVKIEITY